MHSGPTPPLGTLFAIGGAEAKLRRRLVLTAFVEAAGGADARIAIVPLATSLGVEVVDVYSAVFLCSALGKWSPSGRRAGLTRPMPI